MEYRLKQKAHLFTVGEEFMNNNNRRYRILEIMGQDKILFEDVESKNLYVTVGARLYDRVWKDGRTEEVIEWAYSKV